MNKTILTFAKLLFVTLTFSLIGIVLYKVAYVRGYNQAVSKYQDELDNTIALFQKNAVSFKKQNVAVSPSPSATPQTPPKNIGTVANSWGGPQLWDAVNKRRVELGVNPLNLRDKLCTLASIRLNELLELGKLDGHEGFSTMPDRRPDLKWIYEKYNLSEFLVSGAQSAAEAVSLWENTLGHRKLLTGGEYVWGCIYAQNSFAVAITAY